MLATIVYLIVRIRRMLQEAARIMELLADGFADGVELQRRAQRKYPHIGE